VHGHHLSPLDLPYISPRSPLDLPRLLAACTVTIARTVPQALPLILSLTLNPSPYPYPTPTPNQVTIAFREYSDYLDPYRDPIGGRLHALQSLLLLVIFLVGVIEPYP